MTDPPTPGVLVVGDVINDVIVRPIGPAARDTDIEALVASVPGGSGANQATWLAALGVATRLVARVGSADGAEHRRDLSAAGVEPRLSLDEQRPTGSIVVLIGEDGTRSMFTDRGANAALGADDDDLAVEALEGMAHLHVSGRAFASPISRDPLLALWAQAEGRGLTRSVDVGSEAFLSDLASEFAGWTAGADVIFASMAEGRHIAGLDRASPADAVAARLLTRYPVVVLTSGPDGAVLANGSEMVVCASAAEVVVDPTGAGDAFCAGFLAQWLTGATLLQAAEAATDTAAQAIARVGARPPRRRHGAPPWEALRLAAREVSARAHAPYSGLRVGAAGITDRGHVVVGCNVENASFGLTLCAECGLVSALRAAGAERLVAVAIVAQDGQPLTPCGRCRQVLFDNGGAEMLIDRGPHADPVRLGALLPDAFGPSDMSRAVPPTASAGPIVQATGPAGPAAQPAALATPPGAPETPAGP